MDLVVKIRENSIRTSTTHVLAIILVFVMLAVMLIKICGKAAHLFGVHGVFNSPSPRTEPPVRPPPPPVAPINPEVIAG
ncbi:unnamed protein product [Didymodactylos carnosus]|uniref:Energy transducer TonB n=1 Tax=Didymodactylos carnosus TaxID=1234261 RepID=A0A815IF76_9BILA|nr:unnamed protein product [Didymodactylos carnosus]CAF1399002.1 unnamed protein product [Didymodactylos carnosus]CAF4206482.1 unnamed protein product [Didymodactylos carnosus]CAF4251282.1 unnamed protein product [Didymodactylos carnosus]